MVKGVRCVLVAALLFWMIVTRQIPHCQATSLVPVGPRAITIRVDEETLASLHLRVGDCVDIAIRFQPKLNRKDGKPALSIIHRNLLVLAVGSKATVTILVTLEQVEKIVMTNWPSQTFYLTRTSPIFLPHTITNGDPQNDCGLRMFEWREMWIDIYDRRIAISRVKCKYPILDPFSLAHP